MLHLNSKKCKKKKNRMFFSSRHKGRIFINGERFIVKILVRLYINS